MHVHYVWRAWRLHALPYKCLCSKSQMGAPPVVSFLLKRVWCEFFVEACRSIPSSQGHCDSSPSHENYASSRTPVPVTSQTSLGPIVSLEFFLPTDTDWMCDCLAWLDVRLPGLTGCATAWPDWMCDCLAWLDVWLPGLTGCATACARWVHLFHVSVIRVARVASSTLRRWSTLPESEITFVWCGAECPFCCVCLVCLSV